MNPRRLYRSRDRQLAGVAGGMAEYLEIDPTIVRILWILAAIVSGGLILLVYLVLALVVPPSPYAARAYAAPAYAGQGYAGPATGASAGWSTDASGTPGWAPAGTGTPAWGPDWNGQAVPPAPRRAETRGVGAAAITGVVLIVFGVIALADVVLPAWSAAALMGPALLLALGAALVVASIRRPVAAPTAAMAEGPAAAAPTTSEAPAAAAATPWEATDTQPVAQAASPDEVGTSDTGRTSA